MVVRVQRGGVSEANVIYILPILALIASRPAGNPAATLPAQLPGRLDVPAEPSIRQFSAGLEEPGLYAMLLAVRDLQSVSAHRDAPGTATSQEAASPGRPVERNALLAMPQDQVGQLLDVSGQFVETQALHLTNPPEAVPKMVWSTLVVDRQSHRPVQIVTLTEPIPMRRLENVRCLGYFYKVRQDQARKPGPSGERAAVDVPVLVGWLWEAPAAQGPPRSKLAYYVLPAVLGAVFVGFLLVAMTSRQRVDWRTRVEQRRRRRSWRTNRAEQEAEE